MSSAAEIMMHLSLITGINKITGFREMIMFGIIPTTTGLFIVRGAFFFRRERLATCNFGARAASSNATSKHTHALGQYVGGARHMQAIVKFLALY